MPIAQAITLGDEVMPTVCRLDGIVTVVDAMRMADEFLNGEKLLGDNDEDDVESLLIQQIEFCTTIVLNKVDEVSAEQLATLKAVIRQLQPEARIIETNYGKVAVKDILDTHAFNFAKAGKSAGWIRSLQNFDAKKAEHDDDHHDHDAHAGHHHHDHEEGHSHTEEYGISTFVYFRRAPFDQDKFSEFVEMSWPETVIRCKGLLWFKKNPSMSYMFEQAGKQTVATPFGRWMASAPSEQRKKARASNPELDRNWDERYGDRMIKLVFIGRASTTNEPSRFRERRPAFPGNGLPQTPGHCGARDPGPQAPQHAGHAPKIKKCRRPRGTSSPIPGSARPRPLPPSPPPSFPNPSIIPGLPLFYLPDTCAKLKFIPGQRHFSRVFLLCPDGIWS